jgi:hypothetical protein
MKIIYALNTELADLAAPKKKKTSSQNRGKEGQPKLSFEEGIGRALACGKWKVSGESVFW